MKKPRSLARMRNRAKGPVHTIEIHPARNGSGGHAFTTRVHRHAPPSPARSGKSGIGLGYFPSPTPPSPEENVHEDKQDLLNHIGGLAGVKPGDIPRTGDGDSGDENEEE